MKEIQLTKGFVTLVDDEDYETLSQYRWRALKGSQRTWYAARNIKVAGKNMTIMMHREIINAPENIFVDHINMDALDNRRENLRLCSKQENCCNKGKFSNNTSGYKGVSWDKRGERWVAQIRVNLSSKHLGYFDTPEDAARAYDKAARQYHGEFARTNF